MSRDRSSLSSSAACSQALRRSVRRSESGAEPAGRVGPKRPQACGNLGLGEPRDVARCAEEIVSFVGFAELHGAGAVVTDLGPEQWER